MMSAPLNYEEQFGPIRRRWQRLVRAFRWRFKGMLGRNPRWLIETRWHLGDEILAIPAIEAAQREHAPIEVSVWCNYPELLNGIVESELINERDVDPVRYTQLRGAPRDKPRGYYNAVRTSVKEQETYPRLRFFAASTFEWLGAAGGRVVFAPGAGWPTRQWGDSRWVALHEGLRGEVSELIVLGVEGEGLTVGRDLTGRTTVTDCAALLADADVCVSCDSGLMHLALAVGCKTVAMFGPTAPDFYVPDHPLLTAIGNGRECATCWNLTLEMIEPGVCPRGIKGCLSTIEIDTVASAVRNVLAKSERRQ